MCGVYAGSCVGVVGVVEEGAVFACWGWWYFFVVCGVWWFSDGGLVGGRGIFEHPPTALDFSDLFGVSW